jgi:hypothetical protein
MDSTGSALPGCTQPPLWSGHRDGRLHAGGEQIATDLDRAPWALLGERIWADVVAVSG